MAYATPRISATMNLPMQALAPIISYVGTITAISSSLFLSRMFVPGELFLSEVDAAISLSFSTSSNGQGSLSRTIGIYTFGNSTSLQLLTLQTGSASTNTINASFSSVSSWTTGTTTAGASTNLSQFQGGWAVPVIVPMTLSSNITMQPGEYVIANMFAFGQASSTWTVSLFGPNQTNLTNGTASAISYGAGGFISGSLLSSSSSAAVFSNAGTGSVAAIAGATVWTATPTVASALSTGGLISGSFFSATTSAAAISAVGTSSSLPNFGYIGTGSTSNAPPTMFQNGIMGTSSLPTSIALTAAAVSMTGSVAMQQPWFALIGA